MAQLRALVMAIMAVGLCWQPGRAVAAEEATSRDFDANGVKIHYLVEGPLPGAVEGTAEPIVLIHGLYSSAEMNWKIPGVMDALAKRRQVIALDLPGFGLSGKPNIEEAYGLQMVEDVVLLLDHLKIKKAHIVGYSMGGIVALKLIARHPDRVRSGVLGGMGWLRDGSLLQKSWERMGVRYGSRTPAVCIHSISKLALTLEELKGIRTPVEVVAGDRDPTRLLYVRPLQEVRGDWPVVEIKGAGHLDCIARREFREELARWVDMHGGQ
jgi:pimeloyl-ACP methyl ester carboxylesterase